jgi:hypothetical protein
MKKTGIDAYFPDTRFAGRWFRWSFRRAACGTPNNERKAGNSEAISNLSLERFRTSTKYKNLIANGMTEDRIECALEDDYLFRDPNTDARCGLGREDYEEAGTSLRLLRPLYAYPSSSQHPVSVIAR